jgi:hypothetical protein
MKTILYPLFSILGLLFLTGCIAASVPRTTITGSLGGKPFSVSAPKDVDLSSLTVMADTNGAVSIVVKNLKTRMSPDVITTTGDAQVKLITAVGEQVRQGLQAAKP